SDSAGQYVLAVPDNVTTRLTARDPVRDLYGYVDVAPFGSTPIFTADIVLTPVVPAVIDVDPPNHGSHVALGATITVTFSEAIAAASISSTTATLAEVGSSATVESRRSLSADATRLYVTPIAPLAANTLYRLSLSAQVTNRAGTALPPFTSDFTTAPVFSAAALPPNTLRVSLPDANGKVFACGGAQLAVPGTFVTIHNDATGLTVTVIATDANGHSGSDTCDALFSGRCSTVEPGSFCGVVDGAVGDRVQVEVEDVLHNRVVLDAGNMTDERTGAQAIGPAGGVVTFPPDPRYQAFIAADTFTETTIFTLTPVQANPSTAYVLDLNDPNHPEFAALTNPALAQHFDQLGAVRVDLDPPDAVAQRQFDVSVPA